MSGGSRTTGTAVAVACAGALAGVAHGHVAPSPDTNNRYLKVELGHGTARLALTIYFGEVPGARQRRLIDRDRDGTISAAEADAFGADLLRQVAGSVTVELDGAPLTAWSLTEVGLGSRQVTAGAFSVDLALRAPAAAGAHTLWVEDRLDLPSPGEAGLRIEPAPDVTMLAAHEGKSGGGVRLEASAEKRPIPGTTIGWREDTAAAAKPAQGPKSKTTTWVVVVSLLAALGGAVALRGRRSRR